MSYELLRGMSGEELLLVRVLYGEAIADAVAAEQARRARPAWRNPVRPATTGQAA